MTRAAPVLAASLLALAGCFGTSDAPPPPPPDDLGEPASEPRFALAPFADGFDRPVQLVFAPDGRALVVEQGGAVRAVEDGRPGATFLDIALRVSSGSEQGLLSLAFSPRFAEDGEAFVSYTDAQGDSVLARWRVVDGRADPGSERVVLAVEQPFGNHNGGLALFGPDGMLWLGLGDGGSAGDPGNRAQDPRDLLGKLLRLDVRGEPYAVPPDNPFAGSDDARPEVWALGLRNPWRFAFDRATGDLWIGDVGQNAAEEVDFEPAGSGGGRNYGWNVWEGRERFRPGETSSEPVFPVASYDRSGGDCSVTGGRVYRGSDAPSLAGWYVLGDYCSGTLRGVAPDGDGWRMRTLLETELRVTSLDEGPDGALYVVDHGGRVLRVVAEE